VLGPGSFLFVAVDPSGVDVIIFEVSISGFCLFGVDNGVTVFSIGFGVSFFRLAFFFFF